MYRTLPQKLWSIEKNWSCVDISANIRRLRDFLDAGTPGQGAAESALHQPNTTKRKAKELSEFRAKQQEPSAAAHDDASNKPSTSAQSEPTRQVMELVNFYKNKYKQARGTAIQLKATHIGLICPPSDIIAWQANSLFRLLWALGFLVSKQLECVRQEILKTPHDTFFKDDMEERRIYLKDAILQLRARGIELYSYKDLAYHPTIGSWYGYDVDPEASQEEEERASIMIGRFAGLYKLKEVVAMAVTIFNLYAVTA